MLSLISWTKRSRFSKHASCVEKIFPVQIVNIMIRAAQKAYPFNVSAKIASEMQSCMTTIPKEILVQCNTTKVLSLVKN